MFDDDIDSPCIDCGVETLPTDERRAQWYMVTDEVWKAASMGKGFICVGCLEARLGRLLVPADFTECRINDLAISDSDRYAWSYRTPQLTSRLQGVGIHPPSA